MTAIEQPPALYNTEAEQALLGALLFDNKTLDRIGAALQAGDFHHQQHQLIYTAITQLIASGEIADGVTLKDFFKRTDQLAEIGGTRYLMRLMDMAAPLSAQAQAYADLISDLALRRSILSAAQEAQRLVLAPPDLDMDAHDILSEALTGFDIAARDGANLRTLGEAATRFVAQLDSPQAIAIPTGYEALDRRLGGGLFRGDLVILAGRPSMGKTTFANNIARNAAGKKYKIGMFSAEMHAEAIAMRALSAAGYSATSFGFERFHYSALRNGAPGVSREVIARAAQALASLPIIIDDRPGLTVEQIGFSARAMRRRLGGLDVLVVDYLQILGRPPHRGRNEPAVIGEMTQSLKTLARSLDCCIVLLSQLSRQVENRDDKRPQLNDLRESGTIEQDADVVLAAYREEYYLQRREPSAAGGDEKLRQWEDRMNAARGIVDITTLKQRNGPVGTDTLRAALEFDLILNKA